MASRRLASAVGALVASAVCAGLSSPAVAYVSVSAGYDVVAHWDASQPIPWYVDAAGSDDMALDDVVSACSDAIAAWQAVTCSSLSFVYMGTYSGADPPGAIAFRFDETGSFFGNVPALGVGMPFFDPTTGLIQQGTVILNGKAFHWGLTESPGVYALGPVVLHELGHVLGLGHSMLTTSAMFFTEVPHGGLSDDDRRGLCWLYPAAPFHDARACDACQSSGECRAGLACLPDTVVPSSYCLPACSKDAHCPAGWHCEPDMGAWGHCRPPGGHCTPSGGGVALGGPCWEHAVCSSGWCSVVPSTTQSIAYCSKPCLADGDCPQPMTCSPEQHCVLPGPVGDGGACSTNAECTSLSCIALNGTGVCAGACGAWVPCGGGCTCNTGYLQPLCTQPANPPQETCNGVDDDCNGVADEGCTVCDTSWDLQGDGASDIVDVQCGILVTLWFLDPSVGPPPTCLATQANHTDANCDGFVNVVDVQVYVYHALGSALPAALDADADGCPDGCSSVL